MDFSIFWIFSKNFKKNSRNGNQRFQEQQQNPRFARGGQQAGPYWNLVNMLPLIFIFLSLFVYNGQEVIIFFFFSDNFLFYFF